MARRIVRTITNVKDINKLADYVTSDNDIITDVNGGVYLKNGSKNYIKLGLTENSENSEILQSLQSDITSLKSKTTKLKNRVIDLETANDDFENTNNLLDLSTIKKNTTLDTDGVEVEDDIRWLTDFIPLDELNGKINFTQGSYRIGLYEEDKSFIIRTGVSNKTSYKPTTSPKTKYLRLSGTTELSTLMINKGSELLPYEDPIGKKKVK